MPVLSGSLTQNQRESRVNTADSVITGPFGFPTNLRYLRIPSRFVPAIPICGGFLYQLIQTLDGCALRRLACLMSLRSILKAINPPLGGGLIFGSANGV
jgi:hypothetical protein